MDFKGKRIWLIGASTGIGKALAFRLGQEGAILSLSSRSVPDLNYLRAILNGNGHSIVPMDVTDIASVETAWNSMPLPDLVIYNAGAYEPMPARDFNLEQALQMLDTNFTGILRVLNYVIPAFLAQKRGHIVLVGSVAGYSGLPNAIGYGASKAAVIHLAENLRVDLNKEGIKVQLVNPGFVKTRLTDKNHFSMPSMISAEQAADYILKGIRSRKFAIDFPKRFTLLLKFLRILPYSLYFKIVERLK